MAFEPENWGVISSSGSITAFTLQNGDVYGAPGLYTYSSADDNLATILTANYFKPVAHTLAVNDFIEIAASDSSETATVSSVNYETNAISLSVSSVSGNVTGPGSSTNTALVRWNGATGRIIEDGTVLEDGSGNLTGINSMANGSGSVGSPSYTFTGDLHTGMWRSGANLLDFSTNALRGFQVDVSPALAVDYLSVKSAATGTVGLPLLQAKGTDANIDVGMAPKGTGALSVLGATNSGSIKLWNQANTFYAQISAGVMASNINWVWPIADGSSGQVISTNGSGTLSFIDPQKGVWIDQTTTPVTMVVDTGYIADNAGLVTLNVPATAAVGDVFQIVGKGAGGWLVQMNTGQVAHMGSSASSSAGSLASTNQWDCIELLCVTANTTFVVRSSMGNITVA